ncbi:HAD family hydrolase [Streptomyces sp. NPDC003077]|uniref:HAD family hydrolase n=1 Tax=Streptomyces sp. NPDC003077 TaxID=3154443 RepID=UPI0033BF7185
MRPPSPSPARSELIPRLRTARAVLFDVDVVIANLAPLRAAAWKRAFDAFFKEFAPPAPARIVPFDPGTDFPRHFDGLPPFDSAARYLRSRGIDLPVGDPAAPPGWGSLHAITARADRALSDYVRHYGATTRPGIIRLLRALRAEGIPVAAVSAGPHALALLKKARVADLFTAVVSGGPRHETAARPRAPRAAAARLLDVLPAHAAAVERSLPGIRTARQGRFGLVVAVDDTVTLRHRPNLCRVGADLVIHATDELFLHPVPAPAPDAGPGPLPSPASGRVPVPGSRPVPVTDARPPVPATANGRRIA